MFHWLVSNTATVIVTVIVAASAAAAVFFAVRNRKKHSCCGDCSACSGSCNSDVRAAKRSVPDSEKEKAEFHAGE